MAQCKLSGQLLRYMAENPTFPSLKLTLNRVIPKRAFGLANLSMLESTLGMLSNIIRLFLFKPKSPPFVDQPSLYAAETLKTELERLNGLGVILHGMNTVVEDMIGFYVPREIQDG